MFLEPLRVVAEWLRDPATGVNAQLGNVPRDPGEVPPDLVTIVSELDDDRIARGLITRELLTELDQNGEPTPWLFVRMHEDDEGTPFRAQLLPEYAQDDPTIAAIEVLYARRKIESATSIVTVASQKRDAQQVIRTVLRIVAAKFASPVTAYERNGCELTLPKAGALLNIHAVLSADDALVHFCILPLRVLDRWALAITPT